MKQEITITLTAQEAVFLIGFKALPKTLTNKVVAGIQATAPATEPAPAKRTRTRATKTTEVQAPAPALN